MFKNIGAYDQVISTPLIQGIFIKVELHEFFIRQIWIQCIDRIGIGDLTSFLF